MNTIDTGLLRVIVMIPNKIWVATYWWGQGANPEDAVPCHRTKTVDQDTPYYHIPDKLIRHLKTIHSASDLDSISWEDWQAWKDFLAVIDEK